MKKIAFWILFFAPIILTAQDTGKISYEMTMDIHRRMTGDRAQFKEMVPQYRTIKAELLYHDGQAIYKNLPRSEEEVAEQASHGRRMRFGMRNADDIVWLDYENNRRVESREFMDKKFLITGEPEAFEWKLTGETKQVGQYLCHQATYQDSTENVVAWFTPQLPVPLGPSRYGQLPGLILHVDVNDGERTLTALEINLDEELDTSLIVEPKKGKEVTQEEFRSIMHEKMKEMGAQGGRGMMFRTRRSN